MAQSAPQVTREGGSVRIGGIPLTDGRPPRRVDETAIRELEAKHAPVCVAIKDQGRVFAESLHAELRALAGGAELSAVVVGQAHLAVDTMVKHRMLSVVSDNSFSRWARATERLEEAALDQDIASDEDEKRKEAARRLERATDRVETLETQVVHTVRHASGIAVVARDLLLAARDAAKAAKEATASSPTQQLFNRLGVGQAAPASPPDGTGGEGLSGAPETKDP